MMFKRLLSGLVMCALVACAPATTSTAPGTPVSSLPVAGPVCTALNSDKFDLALTAYGAAVDAVNLAIDLHALTPGSPRAVAIANANDKVLAAFAVANAARKACNATSYAAALTQVYAALAEVKTALRS